jgi:two-component system, OmpR family, phosphate regulon sensor histidine kinase PhoR
MGRWGREINICVALLLPALVLGSSMGHLGWWLFFVTALLLVRQSIYLDRLEYWLAHGGIGDQRQYKGIWRDIYYHVWKIRRGDKKRKKKLQRMIERFRISTDALPDAAVVLGQFGVIEWSNPAARQILGLKKSDRGQRIANLVRNPQFVQYLKSNDYEHKIHIPAPTNENVILQIGVVHYGAGLRLMLAQDVTQLKNIERMRTDFVANVSHELRTPLTVLKGYLETLMEMDGLPAMQLRSLQNMATQTERMHLLVDDLLLLARLETKPKKPVCVNVSDLLQQLLRESHVSEKDEARVLLSLDSTAKLHADPDELHSAFGNLLANALKYSADDKPVHIRWFLNQDGEACLEVEDFGEGIAASDIPRITERFYRVEVKRNRKINGTGLGLAIVKHVLARHEARLEIDSQLGRGSRFRCLFPVRRIC